ncbi:hypothetical protein [Phenylobacterium sp.]|jgi:hypothetical protein|uniref:hypothetical protein n=1 Tax=Phenylobacterium sp. TaxID=1871053 RepID=UPI002F91EBEA
MIRVGVAAGVLAAVALAGAAWAEDEKSDEENASLWQKFSACSAAYQVNAKVKDPARTPDKAKSMAALGRDYETAAMAEFRRERRGSVSAAREGVRDLVAANVRSFSKKERTEVEGFIEACPQIEAK